MPNSLDGKLLALDVDGTLLDASGRLQKRTRNAIEAASDAIKDSSKISITL